MDDSFLSNSKTVPKSSYVQCSVCSNFKNYNAIQHRKSGEHRKNLKKRLQQIHHFLSMKKSNTVKVHDGLWVDKDLERFCHFCCIKYKEHQRHEELIVECLGSIYHHAQKTHIDAVRKFLKKNYYSDDAEKYYVTKSELNSFLAKVPEAKMKYLTIMNILDNQMINQIKTSEEERKKLIEEMEMPQNNVLSINIDLKCDSTVSKPNRYPVEFLSKAPPWLEDAESSTNLKHAAIGPNLDVLLKHESAQRKKLLNKKRLRSNSDRNVQSSKWLPSFRGVWNKGSRKLSFLK